MKTKITQIFLFFMLVACALGAGAATDGSGAYVGVRHGSFYVKNMPYRYVGTNFWYGAILASNGEGGDYHRLVKELDAMKKIGIDNLRVLVGGDGANGVPSHIRPTLQKQAGVYNDTILAGLDRLLVEMEKRGMKAILYMNNAWEWSGGYGSYLEWAGAGKAPIPAVDGWQTYMKYVQQFVLNGRAKSMSIQHVKNIVGRVNTITGKPYSESRAIMAWEVANEPRPFSEAGKAPFAEWIQSTARAIREIDHNHLITTGSEGKYGCEGDLDQWAAIHSIPEIDYAVVHIWPYNWGWIGKATIEANVLPACENTEKYIAEHYALMKKAGKPMVLEEFGYPRDGFVFTPGSATRGRDAYYRYVFTIIRDSGMIAGCNFWGWGGLAVPRHERWQLGDAYTGDPAQEEQGLNSVFCADRSTLRLIKEMTRKIRKNR